MEEKILNILKENPYLSNREIGKIVGLSRSSIQYYMNKLGIHRDRKTLQKLNNTSRENKLILSDTAEQIILGSILGDGYISPYRKPENKKYLLNSCLIIKHSIKQKEYVQYKKELLEKENIKCHLYFTKGSDVKEHFIRGNKVKENGSFRLSAQRNVSFNKYRDIFYRNNTGKRVSRYLYKLKALGLAIWSMDDGYKKANSFVLCTNSFTFKEVKLLQKILKHNFNLETTIQKSNLGQPLIYIKRKSFKLFRDTISPYIHESMQYKIGI
jgi:DNA-binding CsgD family transcriptional regulator